MVILKKSILTQNLKTHSKFLKLTKNTIDSPREFSIFLRGVWATFQIPEYPNNRGSCTSLESRFWIRFLCNLWIIWTGCFCATCESHFWMGLFFATRESQPLRPCHTIPEPTPLSNLNKTQSHRNNERMIQGVSEKLYMECSWAGFRPIFILEIVFLFSFLSSSSRTLVRAVCHNFSGRI